MIGCLLGRGHCVVPFLCQKTVLRTERLHEQRQYRTQVSWKPATPPATSRYSLPRTAPQPTVLDKRLPYCLSFRLLLAESALTHPRWPDSCSQAFVLAPQADLDTEYTFRAEQK